LIDVFKRIRIHPLFWVVIGLGVATGYFRELIMLFSIIFCHELGHALAAKYFGWRIVKVELLPFGGVLETEEYGNRPFREEFIVTLSGPVQHLHLMLLSYFAYSYLPFWSYADHSLFILHNLTILLFNLLPILPLDGGRMMQLALAKFSPYRLALKQSLYLSLSFLIVCASVTVIYFPLHLQLWFVLSFLLLANVLEWKQQPFGYQRFLLERVRKQRSPKGQIVRYVSQSMPIQEALKRLYKEKQTIYMIKEKGIQIEEHVLLRYWYNDYRSEMSIGEGIITPYDD